MPACFKNKKSDLSKVIGQERPHILKVVDFGDNTLFVIRDKMIFQTSCSIYNKKIDENIS